MKNDLSNDIAQSVLIGFDRHFSRFLEITEAAQTRFENADWQGEIDARRERIHYYDKRVNESVEYIQKNFNIEDLDRPLWQKVKRQYMWLLYEHKQPELAETFYNSVFCQLFHRRYYNNQHIFVKPSASVDFIDIDNPAFFSCYPDDNSLKESFAYILKYFQLKNPWQNISRDLDLLTENFAPLLKSDIKLKPHCQLQVVSFLFFRNKAAYIVGQALVNLEQQPFIIPILLSDDKQLYVDTIITDETDIALIFSFTRAYFMVHTTVPSSIVSFLQKILPTRTQADIYTSIGFQKQGKSLFYREFLQHLNHSSDKLIIAPGIKGMVMSVFTLPSYPFVFKVIKDKFAPPKDITREVVKQKYQQVKMHDRVGRMADTLEFSHVAFPIDRFSNDLLKDLKKTIASSITIEDEFIIFQHLYIERRMVPLNIYLDYADDKMLDQAVRSYGNAIKEIIAANIFPGDMLLKNFGVTRHGRVVFYDYDEIDRMTAINVRKFPKAQTTEEELSAEPWFHIDDADFFPEQFASFIVSHPKMKTLFMKYHAELLDPEYWLMIQKAIINKERYDIFPYRQENRFINRYAELYKKT